MTPEEQWEWLNTKALGDPRWADTEASVRRLALQVADGVKREGRLDVAIHMPSTDGFGGFKTVSIHKHDVTRVGGYEQVLLIEEILRREMAG